MGERDGGGGKSPMISCPIAANRRFCAVGPALSALLGPPSFDPRQGSFPTLVKGRREDPFCISSKDEQ